MASLKQIKKFKTDKNIIFIPGGPGLGPSSFDLMSEYFHDINVFHYFPSGTSKNKNTEQGFNYEKQLLDLGEEIDNIENPILIGHSFGGILATDIARNKSKNINTLICMATPFSTSSFECASNVFNNYQAKDSNLINSNFSDNPTNENFKNWFAFYSDLYFEKNNTKAGKKMILNDSVNSKSYIMARSESAKKEYLLNEIKDLKLKKLFILGDEDKILPVHILKKDADCGNFKINIIENAGHFLHFDQPQIVANEIIKFISKEGESI